MVYNVCVSNAAKRLFDLNDLSVSFRESIDDNNIVGQYLFVNSCLFHHHIDCHNNHHFGVYHCCWWLCVNVCWLQGGNNNKYQVSDVLVAMERVKLTLI